MTERFYTGSSLDQVTVTDAAGNRPLPHHVRHSPDGFSWGYGGSGPADLARCLLIDALGDEAICSKCEGTATVVSIDGEEMALPRAQQEYEYGDPTSVFSGNSYRCAECEDGVAVPPAMYQAFKFDVIAKLAVGRPWTMPRSQVLAWHRAYAMEKEHR